MFIPRRLTPGSPVTRRLPFAVTLAVLMSWAAGCDQDGVLPGDDDDTADDLSITQSEVIPTVFTVEWTAGTDVEEASVEFGTGTDYGVRAPARDQGDGTYVAVLLGMKADTEYHLRTTVISGGETLEGDDHTVTTGALPGSLPSLDMQTFASGDRHDGFMLTSLLSQPPIPVVIDTDGDYVWWYEHDEGQPAALSRLILSRDGESFILQMPAGGNDFEDPGELLRVSYDGTSVEVIEGGIDGHHDMIELRDGTIAMFKYDTRTVEGGYDDGDKLVELRPDGSEVEIWNVWDTETYPGPNEWPMGWSHANALNYDPDEDAYYLSLRNLHTICKIDRATGDVLWRFGGEDSDFDLGGAQDAFHFQHQFQILDGGIVVFNNGFPDDQMSEVMQYTFDAGTDEAELVWDYHSNPPLYNYGLGDVHRFDDGNTLVTWSTQGQVEEVDFQRATLWRINTGLGAGIAYVTWLESLYGQ